MGVTEELKVYQGSDLSTSYCSDDAHMRFKRNLQEPRCLQATWCSDKEGERFPVLKVNRAG